MRAVALKPHALPRTIIPLIIEAGVIHCCIPNLSGVVAPTATHAFLNAAWPFIQQITHRGVKEAIASDPLLASGVFMEQGKLRDFERYVDAPMGELR